MIQLNKILCIKHKKILLMKWQTKFQRVYLKFFIKNRKIYNTTSKFDKPRVYNDSNIFQISVKNYYIRSITI